MLFRSMQVVAPAGKDHVPCWGTRIFAADRHITVSV